MSDPPKAVFLSYAHDDAAAAQRVADALRAAGVPVWFDQSELRGGDAWDANIREQVETCALFLPIISAHTQARREGYFRLEWNLADDRTHLMAGGTPFLIPVVIDDTPERGAIVPKSFLGVQWTRLAGGEPTAAFVQRVRQLIGLEGAQPSASAIRSEAGGTPARSERRRFPVWGWVAIAAFLVLGAVSFQWPRSAGQKSAANSEANLARQAGVPTTATPVAAKPPLDLARAKSIAVLPFVNRSTDKENEFFTDGMHDDILTQLSRIRELHVTSRTSVEQYRATKKTLNQVGEELRVAYILEGSVQRSGNKVRVTGQLIRAATDEHLWAQSYDRDLTAADVFAIQSELAQAIAGELRAAISPQEKKLIERRPTDNLAAYDLYLKGREARGVSERLTLVVKQRNEALFQGAVALDPQFAEAWGALALARAEQIELGWDQTPQRLAAAKMAMENAVRLAPDSPEVIRSLGEYLYRQRDFVRAKEQCEELLRLHPNDPEIFRLLGIIQRRQGRWTESLENLRKATVLEPGNRDFADNLANTLCFGRRYGEARVEQRRIVARFPQSLDAAITLAQMSFWESGSKKEMDGFFAKLSAEQVNDPWASSRRRDWARMTGDLAEAVRLDRLQPPSLETEAVLLASHGDVSGRRARLEDQSAKLRERLQLEPNNGPVWDQLGRMEALLGNGDEALRCVRKAIELTPESLDALVGPGHSASLAFVHAWTGDNDRAIAEYTRLLRLPFLGGLNVHEMKHHPAYHPLRGDPRFEALLNDPKNNQPLF